MTDRTPRGGAGRTDPGGDPAAVFRALTGERQEWLGLVRETLLDRPWDLPGLLDEEGPYHRVLSDRGGSYTAADLSNDELLADEVEGPALSAAQAILAVAQALHQPASPNAGALVRAAGRHWRSARLLASPNAVGPGRRATAGAFWVPSGRWPQLPEIPEDRTAGAFLTLLGAHLAGQLPRRGTSVSLPVLFDRGSAGASALLGLRLIPNGPPGLHADPARMCFLRADMSFSQSLDRAWRNAPDGLGNRCVVWSLTQEGAPCEDVSGGSLGAALAVALRELDLVRRRRVRTHVLRPQRAVTGRLGEDGRSLLAVGGLRNKLRAAAQSRWEAIAPARDMEDARALAREASVRIHFAHDVDQAWRLVRRRNRRLIGAVAAMAAFAVLVAAVSWRVVDRAGEQSAEQQRSALATQLAARSQEAADPRAADMYALAAVSLEETEETRAAVYGALTRPEVGLFSSEGPWAAFAAEGSQLLTLGDDSVRRWDVGTRQETGTPLALDLTDPADGGAQVTDVAVGGAADFVITADDAGYLVFHDGAEARSVQAHPGPVRLIEASPDGSAVATVADLPVRPGDPESPRDPVRLWDSATGTMTAVLATGDLNPWSVAFSPDGSLVATGGEDEIRLWNAGDGSAYGEPITVDREGSVEAVSALAFGPDGRTLAAGFSDNALRLWDLDDRGLGVEVYSGHSGAVQALSFSPDGGLLATTGSSDRTVRIWDTATGTALAEADTGHTEAVLDLAFSPDGDHLLSAGNDGRIVLWDVHLLCSTAAAFVTPEEPGSDGVLSAALSPDGLTLVTLTPLVPEVPPPPPPGESAAEPDTATRLLRVWDTQSRRVLREWKLDSGETVSVTPDGTGITLVEEDGTLRQLDPQDGSSRWEVAGVGAERWVFSADGSVVASIRESGDSGPEVEVRRTGDGETVSASPLGDTPAEALAAAPRGDLVATGDASGTVSLWEVGSGRRVARFGAGGDGVRALALASDADRAVVRYGDGSTEIWSLGAEPERRARIRGDYGPEEELVASRPVMAFAPGDHLVAIADGGDRVTLHDAVTGLLVHTLETPGADTWEGTSAGVLFGAGGEVLAADSGHPGPYSWTSGLFDDPVRSLCARAEGTLTPQSWAEYVTASDRIPYEETCT